MAALDRMTVAQLDAYASEKGIDLDGCKTRAERIAAISQAEISEAEPVAFDVMGVKGEVDASVFDDFEVFELLGEVDGGNVFAYPKLCKLMFGDDWPRICDELKGGSARLAATRVVAFFAEVMEAVGAKN